MDLAPADRRGRVLDEHDCVHDQKGHRTIIPIGCFQRVAREMRNLLAIGVPVPHAFLARRNKNSLLSSGVRSLEVEQAGWWEDCLAEVPTDSEHCDNWDLHLQEIKDAAVWDDDGVEVGGCNAATLYAGRLNIDWLVNLAFFARRYDYTVRQITVLAE